MRILFALALFALAVECDAQDVIIRRDELPPPTTFAGLKQLRGPVPSGPCAFPPVSLSVDSLSPIVLGDSATLALPPGWQTTPLRPSDDVHTRTRLSAPGDGRVLIERKHNGAIGRPFLRYGSGERPEGMTCFLERGQSGAIWSFYPPDPQNAAGPLGYTALGSVITPNGFWYGVTFLTSSTADQSRLASILTEAMLLPSPQSGMSSQPPESREGKISRVASKDGTLIAVECAGSGPTLIIVHGGIGDRTRWTPMFPLLSPRFTVCAMDRRGHGLSGDSPDYSLQKEAEDVEAVVESRPGTVFVLGHSYGGVSALEAMFLTNRISKLILYEPPVQEPVDRDLAVAGKMERMIRAGAREDATIMFLTDIVQQSPAEVATMKTRPAWPALVSTIDAQLRQLRALAAYRLDAARTSTIRQPTLLLLGSETTSPYMKHGIDSLQASLPNVTRVLLQGQQHNAMDTGREILAKSIITFLLEPGSLPRR